jgi:hypothetical protein
MPRRHTASPPFANVGDEPVELGPLNQGQHVGERVECLPSYTVMGLSTVPNPWEGVTKHRRTKGTKAAVTREQVYTFAWGCIEHGQPEAAAAAVICFEWLQRPENVLAGYLRWTDYRSKEWPSAIKIEHHKNGAVVWHPLEEKTESGIVKFYRQRHGVG